MLGFAAGLEAPLDAEGIDLVQALKQGQQNLGGSGGAGLKRGLVVAEIGLAFVLLVGAGLLTRSFVRLVGWQPGFDTQGLLTLQVFASEGKYTEGEQIAAVYREATERLAGLPGVVSVGTASAGPLFGGRETEEIRVGSGSQRPSENPIVRWYDIGPGYFETLGAPLTRGRSFSTQDTAASPKVAIINESMAREHWPGRNPVGERVTMLERELTLEIVGVVSDTRPFLPGAEVEPEIYWPNTQQPRWATFFVLRTSDHPGALVKPIRDRLAELDPDLSVGNVASMDERVDRRLAEPRFQLLLLGLFAAFALLLAAVGLYAVVAYAVAGRTFEVGVRLALGASRSRIVGSIMGEGLALVVAGLALGVALALALTRTVSSLLHGIEATDPMTFVGVATVLAAVSLLACLVPARRAASVDPTQALRHE